MFFPPSHNSTKKTFPAIIVGTYARIFLAWIHYLLTISPALQPIRSIHSKLQSEVFYRRNQEAFALYFLVFVSTFLLTNGAK